MKKNEKGSLILALFGLIVGVSASHFTVVMVVPLANQSVVGLFGAVDLVGRFLIGLAIGGVMSFLGFRMVFQQVRDMLRNGISV